MTHHTPEGLSPQTAEYYLRGRYGAYRGHFAWRELEEAFNAGLRAQSASVEPVAYRVDWPVEAGLGLPRFFGADDRDRMDNWVRDRECTVHPLVYAGAPHAHIPADVEALRSAVFTVLEGFTLHHDVRKILEKAYYAPSPAQAVDAVDEREAGHVGDTRFEGWLSESVHKGSMYLKQDMRDSYWAGYQERAALQAARQPQAQQGVAAPLELKVCHSQNASQTPQTDLSLVAAPQEWSPAYTRGPARQSAPVAAVPALVPLTEEQMVSAVRPLCNTDQVAERLVAVSIDEYRAIEAASAKLNGLTVGDGTAKAQPFGIRND